MLGTSRKLLEALEYVKSQGRGVDGVFIWQNLYSSPEHMSKWREVNKE